MAAGGVKPWLGCTPSPEPWEPPSRWGKLDDDVEFREGVRAVACPLRAAPTANAAVSAAAPAAAQPVILATRCRAPALSIAMSGPLRRRVRPVEVVRKPFV